MVLLVVVVLRDDERSVIVLVLVVVRREDGGVARLVLWVGKRIRRVLRRRRRGVGSGIDGRRGGIPALR